MEFSTWASCVAYRVSPVVTRHHQHFHLRLHLNVSRVDVPAVAVVECLAGAACYAVSSVLQQTAASAQSAELSMRPGLILQLARSGRWMLGNLMDAGGFLFQLLALRRAALALVEPLFVIGLVFSIVGAALVHHRRPTRHEWEGSLLVVAGLALFLAVAQPGPGHPSASAGGWLILFAVTGAVVGGLIAWGSAWTARRALLLGAATGILYGTTSAVTERTGHLLNGGILHTLSSWPPYVLAVISILGLLVNQSAYQAGELRLSLPVLTVAEPVVAIIIGQSFFGEHIDSTGLAVTGEVIGLVVMAAGVAQLGRLTLPAPPIAASAPSVE